MAMYYSLLQAKLLSNFDSCWQESNGGRKYRKNRIDRSGEPEHNPRYIHASVCTRSEEAKALPHRSARAHGLETWALPFTTKPTIDQWAQNESESRSKTVSHSSLFLTAGSCGDLKGPPARGGISHGSTLLFSDTYTDGGKLICMSGVYS